jgi:transposase
VNTRVWFVDTDGFRSVFSGSMPLYGFGLDDKVQFKFVAISLHRSGHATQEEIAEAFGIGVTTLRLWERQYERDGSLGLRESRRGRPKKIDGTFELAIRKLVDQGLSNREVARRVGVSEVTVRRTVKRLGIERPRDETREIPFAENGAEAEESTAAPTPTETGQVDAVDAAGAAGPKSPALREGQDEASPRGAATLDTDPQNRCFDRLLARLGLIEDAVPLFADAQRVPRVGVLLALPFFVRAGVLDVFLQIYRTIGPAFYGLRSTVVCLFLFSLLRIRRPENLKEYAPGSLGRILGLDRAPEVKTVRGKLKRLARARQGLELMRALAKARIDQDEDRIGVLYVDGHVREYHGKHRLGQTKITRTGRAGPAATDTWVHDIKGDPLFVVTSELNQGLTKMLEPVLAQARALVGAGRKITVVFDRGGFSPRLFARLANDFHIITYWKGKKLPPLPAQAFETHEIDVDGKTIQYRLHDAPRTKVGRIRSKGQPGRQFLWMRRVTRLREDGKQTHVLTTDTDLEPAWVLYRMFNRWRQENFFKYMREEFALDGLLEYGVDDITEGDRPNPKRETLKKKLKKVAAKIVDLLSALGAQAEDKEGSSHKTMQGFRHAHASLRRQLQAERKRAERLHKKIDALPKRVPADDLKTLKREVKLIGDAIKMTAYQVEGELCGLLSGIYPRQDDEGRTLLHAAFASAGQIQVDGDKLRITIEPQSSPHRTAVLAKLCENLNAEDTAFPGSQLRLRFAVEGDQPAKM